MTYIIHSVFIRTTVTVTQEKNNEKYFEYFLNKYIDPNKRILLAYFETSYMDLVVNFYYMSINRLNITNYFLFTTNEDSGTQFKSIIGNPDAHCGFINKNVPYTRRAQNNTKVELSISCLGTWLHGYAS